MKGENMKCLVIVPTTMHNYSFSAPLAWMFSKHISQVNGIFGFQLTEEMVLKHDLFILELNWFIELAEFELLANYIKDVNPSAQILFGGLYAAIKYREIFEQYDVDFYIKGDNEVPVQMLLDGVEPEKIPNMMGLDFENPVTYRYKAEDYKDMVFNMDWFPSYYEYADTSMLYYLPMIVTTKGGCTTVHQGCDYCMGSKLKELKDIYDRPPIVMDNETLMMLLKQVEQKFDHGSLMILSEYDYKFPDKPFDIDMNVEVDSPIPPDKIAEVLYAFKKCVLNISVYEEGLTGEKVEMDFDKILALEDEDHKIKFFAYSTDADDLGIPESHRLYSEDVLPEWAFWDFYQDLDQAIIFSNFFYSKLDADRKFSAP